MPRIAVRALAVLSLLLATISPARAASILAMDFTGGGDTAGIVGSPGSMAGWNFQVNQALTVDSLGLWDQGANGLVASHEVGLWSDAGALLASVIVLGGTTAALVDDSRMQAIAPVTLNPGVYRIAALYLNLNDPFVAINAAVTTIPSVTYLSRNFLLDVGTFQFPSGSNTNLLAANFGPNFTAQLVDPAAVPEPATLSLLGLGLVGAAVVRYRRRR